MGIRVPGLRVKGLIGLSLFNIGAYIITDTTLGVPSCKYIVRAETHCSVPLLACFRAKALSHTLKWAPRHYSNYLRPLFIMPGFLHDASMQVVLEAFVAERRGFGEFWVYGT